MSAAELPANNLTGIEPPCLQQQTILEDVLAISGTTTSLPILPPTAGASWPCRALYSDFAQYFAWVEIVYGSADRLRFASDQATQAVGRAMGDIAWTLAADEFDRRDANNFTTSSLMLWREEQRAIGEMMRRDGDEPGCISFATFATTYDDRFSRWFTQFAADLEDPNSPASDRLANLHRVIVRLVRELDVDRTLVDHDKSGEIVSPQWARGTALGAPTRHTDPLDQR